MDHMTKYMIDVMSIMETRIRREKKVIMQRWKGYVYKCWDMAPLENYISVCIIEDKPRFAGTYKWMV